MSFMFKINLILLIILNYLSVSIFSTNMILLGRNLIPVILIILWISKIILTDTKISLRIPAKIMILFALFFIFNFISIFNSNDKFVSIQELSGLIALFIISFYIVPENVSTERDYISFFNTFNWTIFILLIAGIYIGYGNPSQTFTNYGGRLRYQSILNNTNILGQYMMISCFSIVSLIYLKKENKYIILFMVSLIILILTDSRAAIFSTLIFMGIMFFLHVYEQRKFKKIITIGFIFIIMLSMVLLITIYKIKNISIEDMNVFLSGRIDSWYEPFKQIDYKTILLGTGSYNNYKNPHNYYIKNFLNWGVISTIIIIMIILIIINEIFKISKKTETNIYLKKIYNINTAIFFSMLGYSFFESVLFNMGSLGSIFLWFNLGIIINNSISE